MAKDDEKAEDTKKGGGKGKLIIMIVPVLLLVVGAVYFFVLKPDKAEAVTTLPEPTPGPVVQLDPITVNLAGGHFLKLGMALQPTASAGEEVSGAKALDLAIGEFSGMTLDELSSAKGRAEAKDELVARIKLAYLPEGTTVAAATGGSSGSGEKHSGSESESDSESHPKSESESDSHSESAESEGGGAEAEHVSVADLSAAKAVKLAGKLTVQPLVYDVYLTEFVMQ